MSKIGIIIKREYTSRVMKKSFIILTFVTPIFMAALMFLPIWIATLKDDTMKTVVVVDKSDTMREVLESDENYSFIFSDSTIDDVKEQQTGSRKSKKELTAVLYVTEDPAVNPAAVTLYSDKQLNIEVKEYINARLNEYVRNKKIAALDIPDFEEKMKSVRANVSVATIKWDDKGSEKKASAELALIIGMASAMLIYIFIMSYGAQVMNGVVQEKTNRIVEVIISSVKPFELMMGKIIGVALVGLTQFTIWIVFTMLLSGVGMLFLDLDLSADTMAQIQAGQSVTGSGDAADMAVNVIGMLSGFNFVKILGLFLFYFLGGYLLYASLFAAIGSAVDNETDSQQFTLPVMLPIILAMFLGIYAAQNPETSLAFWGSMIPFTSPVVMMARISYDVPGWEILLSAAILIGTFVASTWMAGKIYRTGILMYGKKVSWKEIWKWMRVN